jgi:phosphoribosylaminoimidazole-succinocarboxamide synthase
MSQLEKLYEGKAKIVYRTSDPDILLTYFKDDATAFNAQKRGTIKGKGEVNCTVSTTIFKWLESQGIPTHYLEQTAPNEMLVKAVKIIPLEVVIRNIAAGSLCRETGIALGTILPQPLVEFYLKNDALGDPLLTSDRLSLLGLVTTTELETLKEMAISINLALIEFFNNCDITLVDFKLEFGFNSSQQIILADEISPDTCRLWDNTQSDPQARVLDKDRFRQDLGAIEDAYQKVKTRVVKQ